MTVHLGRPTNSLCHIENFHINPNIIDIISAQNHRYTDMVAQIKEIAPLAFDKIEMNTAEDSIAPKWNQPFFSWLDALSICASLKLKNPKRYVEIGSGNSTRFARWCIQTYGLRTTITSIDPEPRREIAGIADNVYATQVQNAPLELFLELEEADILFYDGSHHLGPFSDMSFIAYTVMPLLASNVSVAMHDTYLPFLAHNSEDYLLGALLIGGDRYHVDFPAHYLSAVSRKHRAELLLLLETDRGKEIKENHYKIFGQHGVDLKTDMHGCTFFIS